MWTLNISERRTRSLLAALVVLALAACSAAPPRAADPSAAPVARFTLSEDANGVHGSAAAPLVGAVALDVDGALPAPETPTSSVLTSSLRVGGDATPLRYRVSYAFDPGDVLASNGNAAAPTRFGGQSFGQSVELRTPALAGAPIALRLSQESRDDWTVTGRNRQHHQLADLSWSPAGAALDLQWLDPQQAVDGALGLACEVRGSLQLPVATPSAGATQALRFSGRRCEVLTNDARYTALAAQTWKVARVWSGPDRESQLLLSMIDPLEEDAVGAAPLDPSYELAVGLRRSYGPWSAATRASLRSTGSDAQAPGDSAWEWGAARVQYATDTSFTRRLADASVSASWAHDADPLWFLPALGAHTDRFGLALDLSSWAHVLMPTANPRLALSWNWWEAHTPSGDASGDSVVMLQASLTL